MTKKASKCLLEYLFRETMKIEMSQDRIKKKKDELATSLCLGNQVSGVPPIVIPRKNLVATEINTKLS